MSRRAVRAFVFGVLAIGTGAAMAAPPAQQIGDDSTVHRVEAVFVGKPPLSVLRHTVIHPTGTVEVQVVPGTEDAFQDREPAMAIDPVRGIPVLAWSRDTGTGFDIFASRFDEGAWTTPVLVLQGAGDDVRPQIQVSPTLVHVVAHSGEDYVRVSLVRGSLEPAFGPETLPTNVAAITPGVDPSPTPPADYLFFGSDVLAPGAPEPGHVVIWGVRDEPVPIDYVEALLLPATFQDAGTAHAAPLEGSLTVTVASEDRVWFTMYRQTSWLEFSSLLLDESMSLSDVRSLLADMIRRDDP